MEDVDRTIAALLEHALAPNILEQAAITFATPDDSFPPTSVSLPAIDLFLFGLRENVDLRSAEWDVDYDDATSRLMRKRPPMRVDCSYLVTAWPSTGSTSPAFDEHRLLGAVLIALLRYPVLPAAFLQGVLAQSGGDLPTATLRHGQADDMAEFWQALGGRPRVGFGYTVTVPVQPFEPIPAGKPVTDKQVVLHTGKTLTELTDPAGHP